VWRASHRQAVGLICPFAGKATSDTANDPCGLVSLVSFQPDLTVIQTLTVIDKRPSMLTDTGRDGPLSERLYTAATGAPLRERTRRWSRVWLLANL